MRCCRLAGGRTKYIQVVINCRPAFSRDLPKQLHRWQQTNRNQFRRSSIVTTQQLLRDVALHIIRTGCGEGWLLQPKLRDFETSEYR